MLVVLRGNSGSGKSTVSRMLQQELGWPTAVLEQDYFCRVVFDEPDQKRRAHADLLEASGAHCLQQGHHVVLDGIFTRTSTPTRWTGSRRIRTTPGSSGSISTSRKPRDDTRLATRPPRSASRRCGRGSRVATAAVRDRTADRARPLPQRDRSPHPRFDSLATRRQLKQSSRPGRGSSCGTISRWVRGRALRFRRQPSSARRCVAMRGRIEAEPRSVRRGRSQQPLRRTWSARRRQRPTCCD